MQWIKIQGMYLCFITKYKQLLTLTLANNLGFEHAIRFADSRLFWSWLSLCVKEVQAFNICAYPMHIG